MSFLANDRPCERASAYLDAYRQERLVGGGCQVKRVPLQAGHLGEVQKHVIAWLVPAERKGISGQWNIQEYSVSGIFRNIPLIQSLV